MAKWLEESQKEVDGEKNKEKKEALLKKYGEEFAQKRDELAREYAQKLQNIDENITQTIVNEAKDKGYSLVLTKNVAIYGGDDITEEVMKAIE